MTVLIAFLGTLGECPHDHRADTEIHAGVDGRGWLGSLFQDALPDGLDIVTHERLTLGYHFVENRAPAENVGADIHDFTFHLLGRHVIKKGRYLRAFTRHRANHGRNAVTQHFDGAVPLHHDLRRLKAAVEHAVRVRVIQSEANLAA